MIVAGKVLKYYKGIDPLYEKQAKLHEPNIFLKNDGEHCQCCGVNLQHHLSRGNGRKKTHCNFDCLSTKVKLGKKLKSLIMGNQQTVDQNMFFVQYVYRRLNEGMLPIHLYHLVRRMHGIGLLRSIE